MEHELRLGGFNLDSLFDLVRWKTDCSPGRSFENYSFPSPQETGAIGLSPDPSQLVFNGGFQTWNNNETEYSKHAMVVYDFKSNAAYKVPYDDNETRLVNFADVDHAWLMSRFQWLETGEGRYELKLKIHEQPYPWLGRYTRQDHYYVLYPVEQEMRPYHKIRLGGTSADDASNPPTSEMATTIIPNANSIPSTV